MDEECKLSLVDRPAVRITFMAAYVAVFLVCLFGNLFTIVVICAHRSMRTATNFFLANLALADLLVAIFCILQNMLQLVGTVYGHWPLGATLCKLYSFVLHLVPCTGIGILVCVSVEKYIAVLHPLLALKLLTPRFRSLMMASIWALSLLCNMPYYMTTQHRNWKSFSACSRGQFSNFISTRNMITVSFVIWYCIPLCTIAFLYTRIGFVLWHSAPLKQLTQPALRTSSNGETSTLVTSPGPLKNGHAKRSVVSYRMSASAANGTGQLCTELAPARANSKRSNSQPVPNGLLPLIRVNRSSTLSSESGGSSRCEEEEENNGIGAEAAEANDCEEVKSRAGSVGPDQQTSANGGRCAASSTTSAVLVSTVESRKKIIRLLIAIVCSFALLTLPHHLRLLHNTWSKQTLCLSALEVMMQPISYLLLFLSSSINPFLYAFMSQRFRSAIRDIFKCRRGRVRRKSTRTRTQNSDVVACGFSSAGEALSRCASLTRLSQQNTIQPQQQSREMLPMVGSERNLVTGTAAMMGTANGKNHLNVAKASAWRSVRSGSAASSGGSSTASSIIYTHRSNGSLQMAVAYKKCS